MSAIDRPRAVARRLALALALGFAALLGTAAWAQTADPADESPASAPSRFSERLTFGDALERVDTSSPRAVLVSLLGITDRMRELTADQGYTWENWPEIESLETQLTKLFDLREVPDDFRVATALETATIMREALARVDLPPLSEVPDEKEMAARVKEGRSSIYRIPGTPFEISLTQDGPGAGRYQFRRSAITQAPSIYETSRARPYNPDQAYVDGLYEMVVLSPGPGIPLTLIQSLPAWCRHEIAGQAVWQWGFILATLVLYGVILYGIGVFARRVSRGRSELFRGAILLVLPIVGITLSGWLLTFLGRDVAVTGAVLRSLLFAIRLMVLVFWAFIVFRVGDILAALVLRSKRVVRSDLDQQLVRLTFRLLAIIIATIVMIEGMQRVGFSLATMIAGAGVGGLAVALAAQGTLRNIIDGVQLALDKPFATGELVEIANWKGKIESVGLRSTKLRTQTGHEVTIPNELAAKTYIENIGRRPYIRRTFDIRLRVDLSPEKAERAVKIVEEALALPAKQGPESTPHPNEAIHAPGYPPRVVLTDLGSDALIVRVNYWYHPPNNWEYLAHGQSVNLEIMRRFAAEEIELALPTQTLHIEGESSSGG